MKSWWKQLIGALRKETTTETRTRVEPEPGTEELTLTPSAGAFWEKIRDATAARLNTPGGDAEGRRSYEIGGDPYWPHGGSIARATTSTLRPPTPTGR